MGYDDGVSRSAGVRFAGAVCRRTGMGARNQGSLARSCRSWNWGWGLRGFALRIPACGVRGISSELFVLRSQLVFIYAAAGLYGADVPASGPAAKASFWLFTRPVLCFAGDAGGTGWTMVVMAEATFQSRADGRGDCALLLFV